MAIEIRDPAHVAGQLFPRPNGWGSYNIKIVDVGPPEETTQVITVKPWVYLSAIVAYAALQVVSGIIAYTISDTPVIADSQQWTWGGLILAVQLMYFLSSFTSVREDEFGGFFFYGLPVMETLPGLKFRPPGFIQLKTVSRRIIQAQFPGDPEAIFKRSDEQFFSLSANERAGLVLPIRAATAKPRSTRERGESADESALDSQMTLEITFYVRWRILHFFSYHIRVGTVAEGLRQLRDSGERIIIQEVAKRTTQRVIEQLSEINAALGNAVREAVADWGVRIVETSMLSPDVTHAVNAALRDVAVAKAEATQVKVVARAEQVRLTREGRGRAAAKLAELEAMAAGSQALGVHGQSVVDLEKARAIAGENTTIFAEGGSAAGLLGIGARLAAGGSRALSQPAADSADSEEQGDER